MLPYNRGISPNLWSFVDNTPKGVTIHYVDETIDTGGIIAQREVFFDDSETLVSSYAKLHAEIQQLFIENWEHIKLCECPVISPKYNVAGSYHNRRETNALMERFGILYSDRISTLREILQCNI
jgi:methionyl-tRNA formyltransferase